MEDLQPPTTLSHYRIVSKIGEGGMGEVYRARDTKLGRDVAIKVLPASLSVNGDRLNRFEQEAQAAGALNHPNILTIYHIGLHEGAPYIVSELLEGETLRDRLAGGALPQRKAIDYALQIAKGLAGAHEKGIVHRDIKPDNIFITDDGRVKILDFGLAKFTATVDGVGLVVSSDGSTLAFLANSDGINRLYVRKRYDTGIRLIPGTEGASELALSSDGQWLAFMADFTLKKVALNGSATLVTSLTRVNDTRGLCWAGNESIIYAPDTTGGVFQISASGGTPSPISTVVEKNNERTHRWPHVLPGGKAVLFTVGTIDKPDDYDGSNIEAVILATGERRQILIRPPKEEGVSSIKVVLNWFGELRRTLK